MEKKKLTQKELKKYLNSSGMAKQLKFFAMMLTEREFRFRLEFGKGSYTDWKTVVIGIPKMLVGHTKEEIMSCAKSLTAHEIEHINSTPEEPYKNFQKEFVTYFTNKYNLNEEIVLELGSCIINSLEDGRIERISGDKFPKVKNYHRYLNYIAWSKHKITKKKADMFEDTLDCILELALLNVLPKGYAKVYAEEKELMELIKKIRPIIRNFVETDDFFQALKFAWELTYAMEDFFVLLLKEKEAEEKELELLKELLFNKNQKFSQIQEGYGEQISMPETGIFESSKESIEIASEYSEAIEQETSINNEEDSEITHKNKEQGDKRGTNQKKNRNPKPLDTEEHSIDDKNMDSIIEEQMKLLEEQIHEEEHEAVLQADYDDFLLEEEKDGLTEKEKEEILEYYRNLPYSERDGNWASNLYIHRYHYDKAEAPDSIRLAAKKKGKELLSIFLNKKTNTQKNRKRGILDSNSLWKINNKDYSIFEKKRKPQKTDYVFYILVDGSGSMAGNKFVEAYRATSILEEVLGKYLPLKITQFDYGDNGVNHYIVKDFDEKRGNLSWVFFNNSYPKNCNQDGYSIRVALKELDKRKEQKKVLIILSDGMPYGPSGYSDKKGERDIKEAIRLGRKKGVHIFNIMFGSSFEREIMLESFKYMYEKGIISCEPNMITDELLKIAKREIQ